MALYSNYIGNIFGLLVEQEADQLILGILIEMAPL